MNFIGTLEEAFFWILPQSICATVYGILPYLKDFISRLRNLKIYVNTYAVIVYCHFSAISHVHVTFFTAFNSRDDIFHKRRDGSDLAEIYSSYISKQLSQYSGSGRFNHIGALILEPGKISHIVSLFQLLLLSVVSGKLSF